MGKLVKLIVLVGILALAAYFFVTYSTRSDDNKKADARQTDGSVRVEEKYGFTTETVNP